MRPFFILSLLAFSWVAEGKGPSSEIPNRREFPTNPSVSPCKDFYEYTCSKVNDSFKLRDDRSKHTFSFSDSHERLLKAKTSFLSKLRTEEKLSPRATQLKNVFGACMDGAASAKDEIAFVKRVRDEINLLKTPEDLRRYIDKNLVSEDYSGFEFDIIPSQDDPNFYDVFILASMKTLPERSYYDRAEVTGDLQEIVQEFFSAINERSTKERAAGIISLEKEFAQSYPLPAEFRDLFSSKTNIDRNLLKKEYPHIPFDTLLARVPEKTPIRNITAKNFAWLDKALAEKPVQAWKDLFLWHAIASEMDDGYPKFFNKFFAFRNKHLGGPPQRAPRDERCTMMVMSDFDKELDAELVDKIFPKFPTERFIGMAEKVRASIAGGIENNEWLTKKARAAALEKIRGAKLQLVKPLNDEEWDFNPPGEYDPKRPVYNRRLLHKLLTEKALSRLGKPRNRNEWSMGPLTVNAYYSPSDNKFVMPIGILQYPFYDTSAPDEVNLGAVGAVIGHELGHGVDDKGSRYDATGKLEQWMTMDDLDQFFKRGKKLVDQFNKVGHNGELTLGENIGDLVGLTFAYQAAFPNGKGSPEAKKAFFLQYGRVWCGVMRPKMREKLLKTDPHAMGEARVNEQVKHQAGFAEAYQCKEGDAMYLKADDRVRIW